MKRILAIATILFLILAALGCAKSPAARPNETDQSAVTQDSSGAKEQNAEAASTDEGKEIRSYEELVSALDDTSVMKAHISASLTVSPAQEQTFEREGFVLIIDSGAEVTMESGAIPVFFGSEDMPGLVINGTLKVAGTFNFGGMTLQNNGTLEILDGGTLSPGMSTIENHGTILVDQGGTIRLERGTGLRNFATLTNLGEIDITSDGGSLNNSSGATLENNGHITFDGDYQNEGTYTGAQLEP